MDFDTPPVGIAPVSAQPGSFATSRGFGDTGGDFTRERRGYEVDELIDAGDRVVAVISDRQIGRSSGVPIEAAHAAVWTLAEGKVTRLQVFDATAGPRRGRVVGVGSRR